MAWALIPSRISHNIESQLGVKSSVPRAVPTMRATSAVMVVEMATGPAARRPLTWRMTIR